MPLPLAVIAAMKTSVVMDVIDASATIIVVDRVRSNLKEKAMRNSVHYLVTQPNIVVEGQTRTEAPSQIPACGAAAVLGSPLTATLAPQDVTCKRCLRRMAKSEGQVIGLRRQFNNIKTTTGTGLSKIGDTLIHTDIADLGDAIAKIPQAPVALVKRCHNANVDMAKNIRAKFSSTTVVEATATESAAPSSKPRTRKSTTKTSELVSA